MPTSELQISPELDQLIQAIYQGPLEASPWQRFLGLFREAVDGNYATLVLRPPSEGDSGLVLNALVHSPGVYHAYNETWFALDPFVNLPVGEVVTLQEFMPRDELLQTDYYRQYMEPIGVFHNMGADLAPSDAMNARLRVTRPASKQNFGAREKRLCKLLLPHLQQSILLHSELKRTETERELYADAIEQLAMGTLILDEDAQVLRSNRAADQLLREDQRLSIKQGRLQVGNRQDNQAFRALLEEVLEAHRRGEPGFVRAFRVDRGASVAGLGLLLRPLPRIASTEGREHPSVAIFISDPTQRRQVPSQLLSELFGFTPAEAALALLLANGLTLDEASDELGISRNTAKSHLSAVFSKTGITRQTKLVQLILKSVAPFGGAPHKETPA